MSAHRSDGRAVGIFDDRESASPRRIERRLLDAVSKRRKPLDQLIDFVAAVDLEADRDARTRATGVPLRNGLNIIDIEVLVGCVDARTAAAVGVLLNLEAHRPIELDRRVRIG